MLPNVLSQWLTLKQFLLSSLFVVVVQSLSCVWLFVTPWTAACQASLSFTISRSLLKFMSIELVMLSNHLILCCPLLMLSILPSTRVFCNESAVHIRWPKVLEFQLQYQSFQWIFRVDFLEDWLVWPPCSLRESQESSSAPQFESINSSALSLLYGSTLTSNSYMITGKTIALTIWAAVSKVIRLLFNMLSGFVIAFLPRSKYLLVSLLQSPSAVMWCRFIERHICRHEKKLYVLQSVAVGSWRSLAGWRDMVHAVVDQIKIARVEQKH